MYVPFDFILHFSLPWLTPFHPCYVLKHIPHTTLYCLSLLPAQAQQNRRRQGLSFLHCCVHNNSALIIADVQNFFEKEMYANIITDWLEVFLIFRAQLPDLARIKRILKVIYLIVKSKCKL